MLKPFGTLIMAIGFVKAAVTLDRGSGFFKQTTMGSEFCTT